MELLTAASKMSVMSEWCASSAGSALQAPEIISIRSKSKTSFVPSILPLTLPIPDLF